MHDTAARLSNTYKNRSFTNQDTLIILTGCLLENEQDGEPVVVRDRTIFNVTEGGERLTHLLNENPTEMLTSKEHIFPDSVCADAFGIQPVLLEFLERKKQSRQATIARTDTTGQISRLTLNGACLRVTRL